MKDKRTEVHRTRGKMKTTKGVSEKQKMEKITIRIKPSEEGK